jgi:hypothetical protein
VKKSSGSRGILLRAAVESGVGPKPQFIISGLSGSKTMAEVFARRKGGTENRRTGFKPIMITITITGKIGTF